MANVTIIVPTLNESGNIHPLLERISGCIPSFADKYEVIFSDSGSTDGTCLEIMQWSNELPVKLNQTRKDLGLARAVLDAIDHATGEIIVVLDADLSHPPEKIVELVRLVEEDGYDMAIGSRYVEGGSTPDWPLKRRLISKIATIPARFFTDVYDPMAGFFAIKKEYCEKPRKTIGGFKIGFELLTTDWDEFRVVEIPIQFRDRELGKSKMGKRVIFEYVKQLLYLAIKRTFG